MMKSSTLGLQYDGPFDLDMDAIDRFLNALIVTDDGELDNQLAGKIFYVTYDDEQRHYLRWPSDPPFSAVIVAKFFNKDGMVVFELGDDFNLASGEIAVH
jgi:hypothetical protein